MPAEKNQPIIADGVVLAFFVSTLSGSASAEDQQTVVRALRSLASTPVNRERILDAGALPPVVLSHCCGVCLCVAFVKGEFVCGV